MPPLIALIECYYAKMNAFIVAGQPLKLSSVAMKLRNVLDSALKGKDVDPQIVWTDFEIVNGNARIKEKSTGASNEKSIDAAAFFL
jgi:hypothetical protein